MYLGCEIHKFFFTSKSDNSYGAHGKRTKNAKGGTYMEANGMKSIIDSVLVFEIERVKVFKALN